ncbi:hydrolase [Sporosarcina sp. Te-1]|uniref:hydrolase n=1 Tax=Sporosarcina sp. Te-1 TaxID=2818390 RepID=UPI001A9E16A9|nr:hydrolase [Sporosarcina sp. Te-1]QTD42550.1 hydrolase [Sporosarcina sp. Te-1]
MLTREQTIFVLVDVQGKLSEIVHDSEVLLVNLSKLLQALKELGIPILWLEQYPEGLGPTNKRISAHLQDLEPIAKITFSGCKNEAFMSALEKTERKQVLMGGIETHICVYQTAVELAGKGYEVQVVEDAVSSRTLENKELGLRKMERLGVDRTSVETALYELLERADIPEFKELLRILK